ncbi:MAG: nicotinate-nucleotide diphosphorylase (carboxylating) [Deltaproteobacteria bacterium]|nr:MAG: nicotinate-nucleotide diphosphorylase (carboxylating) [Deltaproteobacteria bacterium]
MNHTVQRLIDLSLTEDIGPGDITTDSLIDPDQNGKGTVVAKEPIVVAGIDVAKRVFETLDNNIFFNPLSRDGDILLDGELLLEVEGAVAGLLRAERTALNFLQRLCGIASHVNTYVEALNGYQVRLVDTRKTTPGWRQLEKYAVRIGGAHNHRMGLYDGMLIKTNHIALCGGITPAVEKARQRLPHLSKIEVEVSTMNEVVEAVSCGVDIILLDKMNIPEIAQAVSYINGHALVEVSGLFAIEDLKPVAETGVDIISVGALIHQAQAVDLSMRIHT